MSETSSLKKTEEIIRELNNDIDKYAANKPVTIIAASKHQGLESMDTVYRAGIRHFGENRGQEVRDKAQFYSSRDIHLSFIGHLQKNKVKYIMGRCHLIQSVDSIALAKYLNERYDAEDMKADILIEINISEESSKSGFFIENAENAIQHIRTLKCLNIRGIMTIGPLTDNDEIIERTMKAMHDFHVHISGKYQHMDILSMGMTDDYKIALKHGSNMIRIGRKLFGGRSS